LIVIDASGVILLISGGAPAERVSDRIRRSGETLHAPQLLSLEVLNAIRRAAAAGRVPPDTARAMVEDFRDLRCATYPHEPLLPRVWELRENLTAYDAAYVALAEALEAPLVTLDRAIADAPGIEATVELLG
jgi:predicted nucleic acid-binding protein